MSTAMEPGISSVEAFESALRGLIHDYVRTLSPRAPSNFNTLRLSVAGPGFSVIYDKPTADSGEPTLTLSLTPTPTQDEGRRR